MPVPQPQTTRRRRHPLDLHPPHSPDSEPAFNAQADRFQPLAAAVSRSPRQRSGHLEPGLGRRTSRHRSLRMAHPLEMPVWVRYVVWWRQTTTGGAVLTFAITTGLYSWTVYTQHRWSVQFEALEQMQRNDRQFQLTQESMANSLRETAVRGEMVPLVPDRMIDLPVLPLDPAIMPALEPDPDQSFGPRILPVGY